MDFQLNCSPHLTMADITIKLFNCKFLSDVQFLVDDKLIYAHSLELMKRTVVFQNELITTLGENKLIPIDEFGYDGVYQFIRYIYTDECAISDENSIDLLKLAKRYRVIKLENKVIESICDNGMRLKMFEYCLVENDQLYMRHYRAILHEKLIKVLESQQFLTVCPAVIEEIFGFERVNISEYKLFKILVQWIEHNAADNQVENSQCQTHYKKLIDLIRFPAMTVDEVIKCVTEFPYLFNDCDHGLLFKTLLKASDIGSLPWNTKKRLPFEFENEWSKFSKDEKFETSFTVNCEMFLVGLRFGNEHAKRCYEIIFTQQDLETKKVDSLTYRSAESPKGYSSLINLDESIRVLPNNKLSIQFKYLDTPFSIFSTISVLARKELTPFHTNVSSDKISINKCSRNMYEMFFKLVNV